MNTNKKTLLRCEKLSKAYKKDKKKILAVSNVDLEIGYSKSLGLVGESGSGKSSLARLLSRLEDADSGKIFLNDQDITNLSGKKLRKLYRDIQMVFQDPMQSFNPRMRIGESIEEFIRNLTDNSVNDRKKLMKESLVLTGLDASYAERYPHQLSGGECQRAAIARAISISPSLLICDEATSALDVSIQAQILSLLKEIQENTGIAYLFISHDLAVVSAFCSEIAVMYNAEIVERGNSDELINNPQNDYTKQLISSVFALDSKKYF